MRVVYVLGCDQKGGKGVLWGAAGRLARLHVSCPRQYSHTLAGGATCIARAARKGRWERASVSQGPGVARDVGLVVGWLVGWLVGWFA